MCPLCAAEPRTPWLGLNGTCWVALCSTCWVPMVVMWRHTAVPTPRERTIMRQSLVAAARPFYGAIPFQIDREMHTHPAHAHMHARG